MSLVLIPGFNDSMIIVKDPMLHFCELFHSFTKKKKIPVDTDGVKL